MKHIRLRFLQVRTMAYLVLTVCMALPVQARRVYVHGRVYDEGGDPVELATVNKEHIVTLLS